MEEDELIALFTERRLNEKTNNFIFTNLEPDTMIKKIPSECRVWIPEVPMLYGQNIKLDLEVLPVKDILNEAIRVLEKRACITFDSPCDLTSKFSLFHFENELRKHMVVAQLLLYHVEYLTLEEQMLFNELYYFFSFYFNVTAFLKGEHFKTYFLEHGRVLDERENYTKIDCEPLVRKRQI